MKTGQMASDVSYLADVVCRSYQDKGYKNFETITAKVFTVWLIFIMAEDPMPYSCVTRPYALIWCHCLSYALRSGHPISGHKIATPPYATRWVSPDFMPQDGVSPDLMPKDGVPPHLMQQDAQPKMWCHPYWGIRSSGIRFCAAGYKFISGIV